MAKFFGKIGFGSTSESKPGVFTEVITERSYYGDVARISRQESREDEVNVNLRVSNSISIVADGFLEENFIAIRYVEWMGKRWTVGNVTVQRPRLVLEIGEVYNGPPPSTP